MSTTRAVSRILVLSALAVLVLTSAAVALEAGQKAPDFSLNGTDGKPVKLKFAYADATYSHHTLQRPVHPDVTQRPGRVRRAAAAARRRRRPGRGR